MDVINISIAAILLTTPASVKYACNTRPLDRAVTQCIRPAGVVDTAGDEAGKLLARYILPGPKARVLSDLGGQRLYVYPSYLVFVTNIIGSVGSCMPSHCLWWLDKRFLVLLTFQDIIM